MLINIEYNRKKVFEYAKTWATKRNPRYYDFGNLGGDCTNFVSQCVYAGCGVMNFTPVTGWYFISANNRSPSWSGVEFFYNFFVSNSSVGPYGKIENKDRAEIGDVIQLQSMSGRFYHSLVVTSTERGEILVSSHDNDAFNRPLNSYAYHALRCIHIIAARKYP